MWNQIEDEEERELAIDAVPLFTALMPNASLENLCSYLFDCDFILSPSPESTLDMFEAVQDLMAHHIQSYESNGYRLTPEISKAYLKFRHNAFGNIFLQCIGINEPFSTDVSLVDYGSDKTPDYILRRKDSIYLLDFAVATNLDSIFMQKGGGLVEYKYSHECEIIAGIENKPCSQKTIPLALTDRDNLELDEVLSEFDALPKTMFYMNHFKNLCWKHRNILFPFLEYSFGSSYEPTTEMKNAVNVLSPSLGSHTCNFDYTFLPEIFCQNITEALDKLKSHISSKKSRKRGAKPSKSKLLTNRSGSFLRLIPGEGLPNDVILSAIEAMDIKTLSEVMFIVENNIKISVKDLGGTVVFREPKLKQNAIPITAVHVKGAIPYERNLPVYHACYLLDCLNTCNLEKCSTYIDNLKKHKSEDFNRFDYFPDSLLKPWSKSKFLFDDNYFNKLVNFDYLGVAESDKSSGRNNMLCNNAVDSNSLQSASLKLTELQDSINSKGKFRLKRSFQIPLVTGQLYYGDPESLNNSLADEALRGEPYTYRTFQKARKGEFVRKFDDSEIVELNDIIAKLDSKLFLAAKELYTKIPKKRVLKEEQAENKVITGLIDDIEKKHSERRRLVNEKSRSSTTSRTVSINATGKNQAAIEFKNEMDHYGKYIGLYGVKDTINDDNVYSSINRSVRQLHHWLLSGADEACRSEPADWRTGPGPKLLDKAKQAMLQAPINISKDYRNSNLGKCTEFAARLCYTLLRLSTNSNNHKLVTYDNLGYKNVLLICRGGKKMAKTSTSRLYRLIHPYDPEHKDLLGYNETHKFIIHNGQHFVLTPWMQMNDQILKYGLKMFNSIFMDITVSCLRQDKELSDLRLSDTIGCFLAFHQKRQTEVALHNSRYLIVNSCGEYSHLEGVIPSFCSYNHSYFDAWIKESIKRNLSDFLMMVTALKNSRSHNIDEALSKVGFWHLITRDELDNSYALTSSIYITYNMTTGQYNRAIEQVANLESIIEDKIASEGNGLNKFSSNVEFDLLESDSDVYENDFKFDPQFCQFLGKTMSDYLVNKVGRYTISNAWEESITASITTAGSSNGLRGFNRDTFFNKKGYEVTFRFIYEHLLKDNLKLKLQELDLAAEKEKINLIRADYFSLGDSCICWDKVNAFFHVVEKKQRAGNREIYVMDIFTKFFQQPFEKFMGKLCSHVDNEYISIPSDARAAKLHSSFYEGSNSNWAEVTNLVLDCRRWAPRSVLQKYMHFIHGMSDCLPESFRVHSLYFLNVMLKKRFVTRDYVVDSFKNNANRKWMLNHLTKNSGKLEGSYSLTMSASFVMGMFNFLSSLMHAANQMVISEVTHCKFFRSHREFVLVKAVAHSDDSTAKVFSNVKESTYEVLAIYDYLLKSANHMISVKKSVVSKIYQEFLSILYFMGEMVPVVKKFIGSLPFQPSDKGYSVDVTYSASKCIELLQQGGTMQESYVMMKVTEKCIRDFYRLPELPTTVHYGSMGIFDPHPIELLIGGTPCEFIKHCLYNAEMTEKSLRYMHAAVRKEHIDFVDPVVKWDMGYYVPTVLKKLVEEQIGKLGDLDYKDKILSSWTIKNGQFDSLISSHFHFISMLSDKSFYRSLVSDDPARSLTRVYGAFRARSIISDYANIKPDAYLSGLINYLQNDTGTSEYIAEFMNYARAANSEIIVFYESLENMVADFSIRNQKKTLKPTQLYVNKAIIGFDTRINIPKVVTYLKEKELYHLYGDRGDPVKKIQIISSYLDSIDLNVEALSCDDLYKLLRTICGRTNSLRRCLAYVPPDGRFIRGPEEIMDFIAHNSLYAKTLVFSRSEVLSMAATYTEKGTLVPKAVTEYSRLYWTKVLIDNNGLAPYAKPELSFHLNRHLKNIDPSWRSLIASAGDNKTLADLPYWMCWLRSQKRVGSVWLGSGLLFVHTPEFTMSVHLQGTLISLVTMNCRERSFSQTTSWYLSNIVSSEVYLLPQLTGKDSCDVRHSYLSFANGQWGLDMQSDKCLYFKISNQEHVVPEWYGSKLPLVYRSGKNSVFYQDVRFEIKTVIDQPLYNIPTIKKYLDIETIKLNIKTPSVRTAAKKLRLSLTGRLKVSDVDLYRNFLRSTIYKIYYTFQSSGLTLDGKNSFLKSLMHYKKINVDFGFPSNEELSAMVADPMSLCVPDTILDCLGQLREYVVSDETAMLLRNNLNTLIVNEEYGELEWAEFRQMLNTGVEKSLVMVMSKSLQMYRIIMYGISDKLPHFDWLCTLFDAVIDYIPVSTEKTRLGGIPLTVSLLKQIYRKVLDDMAEGFSMTICYNELMEIMGSLADGGLLEYLNFKDMPGLLGRLDYQTLGSSRFVNMISILICNMCMIDSNVKKLKTLQKKPAFIDESVKHFAKYKWKKPQILINASIVNGKKLKPIKLLTLDPIPGFGLERVSDDEVEDCIDELDLDGDIDGFDLEEIEEDRFVYFHFTFLKSSVLLKTLGTSTNLIITCYGFDNTIYEVERKLKVFIKNDLNPIQKMYAVCFTGEKIRLNGFQTFKNNHKLDASPKYIVSDDEDIGLELFNHNNFLLRNQFIEKANVELMKKDASVILKEKMLEKFEEQFGKEGERVKKAFNEYYKSLEVKVEKPKRDMAVMISDVIDSILNNNKDSDELLKRKVDSLVSKEKCYIPVIKKPVIENDKSLIQDEKLLGEMDSISHGLAERLIEGHVEMSAGEVKTIKILLNQLRSQNSTGAMRNETTAFSRVIDFILSNCKIVRNSNAKVFSDLSCCISNKITIDEEDTVLPLPDEDFDPDLSFLDY
jgi:hypothetical protein